MRRLLFSLLLVVSWFVTAGLARAQSTDAGADPAPSVQQLLSWKQCREYLPKDKHPGCRIDFDMRQTRDGKAPPQTHKDITVHLGTDTRGVVVLWHSSPFAACSLTTQPGPLGRDISTNVGPALTAAAGLGAFLLAPSPAGAAAAGTSPGILEESSMQPEALSQERIDQITTQFHEQEQKHLEAMARTKGFTKEAKQRMEQETQSKIDKEIQEEEKRNREAKVGGIQEGEKEITKALQGIQETARLYDNISADQDSATIIRKNLFYSYEDDKTARSAKDAIKQAAIEIVGRPLPDGKTISSLQKQRDDTVEKIDALEKAYPGVAAVTDFVRAAREQIGKIDALIRKDQEPAIVALVAYATDSQAKVQKILDFIKDWEAQDSDHRDPADASVQALPIALYPESKVAVTVKCADAVTASALFDSLQFNGYFQRPPIFDISSGLLISTLHGRKVTTQSVYSNPSSAVSCPANPSATPPTTSNCPTVVINRTRPQFMPGVFAEVHAWNFKLPWVRDPAYDAANLPGRVPTWMSDKAPRHALGYVGSLGLAGGFMVNPNNGTTQAEFFEGISFGIQRFVILIGNHNGRSQNLTGGYYEGAPVTSGTTPATVSNWANGFAFGITYRIPLR